MYESGWSLSYKLLNWLAKKQGIPPGMGREEGAAAEGTASAASTGAAVSVTFLEYARLTL
jgi:hypothetical protein